MTSTRPGRRLPAAATAALAALVCVVAFIVHRRGPGTPSLDASTLADPIHPGIRYAFDSLPNGLHYYVYGHPFKSERVELRLVVDAGSVEEDDDQRGLAHAVEHMVFRGTRRFPHGAIDRYLESIGMRRGNDVNAHTSLDDTQYELTVPSGRIGAIDTALAMLASIAGEARFDSADARLESGVLLEEWRLSRGADARIADARTPLLYAGTPYAARPVIGDTGILRRLDVGAMKRYYARWYRPELMAVVVVGEFDQDTVQTLVRKHFTAIPSRVPRVGRPTLPNVHPPSRVEVAVVPDQETQSSSVGIWTPVVRNHYTTTGGYRTASIGWLWREVLAGRLEDATLEPSSSLADVNVDRQHLARRISADVVSATAIEQRALPALDAVAVEMATLARFGPTRTELDERARAIIRATRERAQAGDGSDVLAEDFVDNFLTGNPIITSNTAYDLARVVLPTITTDEVREFARERQADSGAIVVVAATVDDSVAKTRAASIAVRLRAARERTPVKEEEPVDVRRSLASDPVPGRIATEKAHPDIKTYEWTLSNGMHVFVKPTSFMFDEIQFRAVAPGGASLADERTYPSAYLADAIIGATGVGDIPAPRLRRWLAANSISLSPTVSDDEVTIDGHTSPADLDDFFALLHLYLTAPRRDTVAFRRYQARAISLLENRARDPDDVYRDSVAAAFVPDTRYALRNGAAFYRSARLDDALDFWKHRTSNASGFSVAIAGDVALARLRPLVERYLASIPRGVEEHPRARGGMAAQPVAHHEIAAGIETGARTTIGFSAPFELSNNSLNTLNLVRDIVALALTARLRDELGGTYDVDVSLRVDEVPARYALTVAFEASPDRIDALAAAAVEELQRLRSRGPKAAEFSAAREARVRDFDGRVGDNDYWVEELTFHATHGWPLSSIPAHSDEVEAITLADARRACAASIPARGFVRLTMRPRSPTPTAGTGTMAAGR